MINKDIKIITVSGFAVTVLCFIICSFFDFRCSLVCLVLGLVLTLIFLYVTKKRYKKINEFNNYLSLICAGRLDLDIADNTEGELSILKNNLYKVMTLLRFQNEFLQKDKLYLADSLADISHQLKTPLTSMIVMTDLLREEKSADKRTEFINIIESQLDKMKWLTTNLLKLSKLDAGTAQFKKEDFSIKSVIEKSIKPFLITLDLKGMSLVNLTTDFIVNGDSNWSEEAFSNIIKNCIEHTQKNGELTISSKITNLYDAIIISDNGCGIEAEDLPHIFERFYHGKNSSGDSVGIGLALAKTVFEKENGEITVTSEPGKGSRFEIRFYKSII